MSLSVIVPSRTPRNLLACITGIRAAGETCRIIVVDDFPVAGMAQTVLEDCPNAGNVEIIAGVKPFVYARNCNVGIAATQGGWVFADAFPELWEKHRDRSITPGITPGLDLHAYVPGDDVVLLNDDAIMRTPGGFTAMQKLAEEHPEYGIIASTCNQVGNMAQWPKGVGLRDEPRMVCFVAVLIPRRTIDLVGLLDERFVHYGCDDDDYSLRVRLAGLKIGIWDGCYCDHGSLISTYRGLSSADCAPNLEIFRQKWGFDNWGNA